MPIAAAISAQLLTAAAMYNSGGNTTDIGRNTAFNE